MNDPTRAVGSYWPSKVPARGLQVAGDRCLVFAVEGRGRFPRELLAQDDVSVLLDEARVLKTTPAQRMVILIGRGCTPSRWTAAGWRLHLSGVSEHACSEAEYRRPRNFFGEVLS